MVKFQNYLAKATLWFVSIAFALQLSMVVLSFTNPDMADKISKKVIWKIDGTFK